MLSTLTPPAGAALALGFLTLAAAAAPQAGQGAPPSVPIGPEIEGAPFRVLDNDEGAWIDLVFAPVRPMAFHPITENLYAVNSHDASVVEYAPSGELLRTIRVPWGPVSLAVWPQPWSRGASYLLVVCRGTQALAYVNLVSGLVDAVVELPVEPADILIHPTSGHAFVSCSGDDSVVEVDVRSAKIERRYAIPSKRPTFLALAGDDVLVAPMLSGNNSIADTGSEVLDAGPDRVVDLEDPTLAQDGLRDHDLFRITPGEEPVAVAKDMGAVLFALGVNPTTGDVWQLGTEANNKDATRAGEPAIRGDIVVNQVALVQPAAGAGNPPTPFSVLNLDDADPATQGVQFDSTRTVGQPYGLDFDVAGNAYVVGLLSDNVTQLTAAGAFVREWNVGKIPRAILVREGGEGLGAQAYVYCWGSNEIEVYSLVAANPPKVATLDVGYDPTPAQRHAGRLLFYDGDFSMHGNASCNSCHIETESDLLAWDLSNLPFDDKGPLVTQTMRGIADLVPFHWRGERDALIDFNPAFDGLLGGPLLDTTPGGEFDQFEAFLFSVEQPANPNEDPRRIVNPAIGFTTPGGVLHLADAVRGQDNYFDATAVQGVGSCNDCHTLPTGTSNEIILDEPNLEIPRRNHFAVPGFQGIWRKEQATLDTVVFADGSSEERPTLGSGVSASGLKDSMFDFVNIDLFSLSSKKRRNITAFLNQLDSGLAPAIHKSWVLDASGTQRVATELSRYLLLQAGKRNCDIAVFGEVDLGGPRTLRWFWNRDTERFHAEDSSVPPKTLGFFIAQAESGFGSNVFLGLPVGMGERFAVDYDADGLYNLDEIAAGTDPTNADSDGDLDPDGHEAANGGDPTDGAVISNDTTAPVLENVRVVYTTVRVAKIQFDTAEPTRFDAAWVAGTASGSATSGLFEKTHSVLLTDLKEDRLHTVTLTATDLGGNATQLDVPGGIQTEAFAIIASSVFRGATATEIQDSGGTLHFRVEGKARRKGAGLLSGHQLRVQVFVNGVMTQSSLQGTISGGDGFTSVEVVENGLSPGDEVVAMVSTLFDMNQNTAALWSMPDTDPEHREFKMTYAGDGP